METNETGTTPEEHGDRDASTIAPEVIKAADKGMFGSLGALIHKLSHREAPSEADGDMSDPVLAAKVKDLGKMLHEDALDSLPPQPRQRDE